MRKTRMLYFDIQNPILTFKIWANIIFWQTKSYFDIGTGAEYRILTFKLGPQTQSFSFYLPEDALHEILIKLAPYTLYYFGSVNGRRRCTIGILMPDLSSFINRQLKSDFR